MATQHYLSAIKTPYRFNKDSSIIKIHLNDYSIPDKEKVNIQIIGSDLYISFSDSETIQLEDLPITQRLRIITERTLIVEDMYYREAVAVMPIIT